MLLEQGRPVPLIVGALPGWVGEAWCGEGPAIANYLTTDSHFLASQLKRLDIPMQENSNGQCRKPDNNMATDF